MPTAWLPDEDQPIEATMDWVRHCGAAHAHLYRKRKDRRYARTWPTASDEEVRRVAYVWSGVDMRGLFGV